GGGEAFLGGGAGSLFVVEAAEYVRVIGEGVGEIPVVVGSGLALDGDGGFIGAPGTCKVAQAETDEGQLVGGVDAFVGVGEFFPVDLQGLFGEGACFGVTAECDAHLRGVRERGDIGLAAFSRGGFGDGELARGFFEGSGGGLLVVEFGGDQVVEGLGHFGGVRFCSGFKGCDFCSS